MSSDDSNPAQRLVQEHEKVQAANNELNKEIKTLEQELHKLEVSLSEKQKSLIEGQARAINLLASLVNMIGQPPADSAKSKKATPKRNNNVTLEDVDE